MADQFNPIWIGFAFAQDFDFDVGAIPGDAGLWLDLRRVTAPKAVLVDHVVLARVSATRFRLLLSQAQTALYAEGSVEGDFILRPAAGNDVHLGVRLTIPVLRSASEPGP